jgi:hypothetical protein
VKINLKNVESASVATAFARYDFPVPGGPYSKKARQGRRFPVTIKNQALTIYCPMMNPIRD